MNEVSIRRIIEVQITKDLLYLRKIINFQSIYVCNFILFGQACGVMNNTYDHLWP